MLAEQTRDEVFEAGVRAQLELIEAALLKAAEADSDMVTEAAQHIIAAGGKRFRPLLVVLGSYLGPYAAADDVVKAAVVVELTHVASLYHDDVMDEARMRRGSVSANSRWGNTVAILVGDLLFARASDIVCDLGPEFVRLQARTFSRLVQGQIAETVGPSGADPLDHYLRVVADKTGSLIATSALFGPRSPVPLRMCSGSWPTSASRLGWSFSSATTSSTSPATKQEKRQELTFARVSQRCRRSSPESHTIQPMPGCSNCSILTCMTTLR